MKSKRPRMGGNPLEWIRSTKEAQQFDKKNSSSSSNDKRKKSSKKRGDEVNIDRSKKPYASQGSRLTNEHSELVNSSAKSGTRFGLPEGWLRVTYIQREIHYEKIKAISFWERRSIKDIVDEIIENAIREREAKEPILPIPTKKGSR